MRRRVLVIGLDGVPWSLVREWTREGVMPNLAALVQRGSSGGLASTVPPTSAPSWSSFITGMNPGKTGVYDFLYRRQGSYQFPPVNSGMRGGKPIWSIISEAGGKVGVVNLPMSYPVDKVNGFMVSGWMTPHQATDYLYPAQLAEELRQAVGEYRIYPTETFSESSREAFFRASYDLMKMRTTAFLHLLGKEWDFFMAVYFDTDRILHQLWHYLDESHPWREGDGRGDLSREVKAYFHELDARIGLLLERAGDATVLVMSDHGMGAAHRFVVLNNWLLQAGLMKLLRNPVTQFKRALFRSGFTLRNVHMLVDKLGLAAAAEYKANYFVDHLLKRVFLSFNDVDWGRTSAYSYGRMLGSIYLNVRGREPRGIVEPGAEYERVRRSLVEALGDFRDPYTGAKLIGRVALREEIYSGARLAEAPDIVAWPAVPEDIFFGLTDFGSARLVDAVYRYSGMHREEGLLVAAGKGIRRGTVAGAGIADLAPTILYLLGLPVPLSMDGKVLEGMMEEREMASRPVSFRRDDAGVSAGEAEAYTPGEEKEIMDRLSDLGYLG